MINYIIPTYYVYIKLLPISSYTKEYLLRSENYNIGIIPINN